MRPFTVRVPRFRLEQAGKLARCQDAGTSLREFDAGARQAPIGCVRGRETQLTGGEGGGGMGGMTRRWVVQGRVEVAEDRLSSNLKSPCFRAGLRSLPYNAKMHYNFANLLKDTSQPNLAVHHYQLALW